MTPGMGYWRSKWQHFARENINKNIFLIHQFKQQKIAKYCRAH